MPWFFEVNSLESIVHIWKSSQTIAADGQVQRCNRNQGLGWPMTHDRSSNMNYYYYYYYYLSQILPIDLSIYLSAYPFYLHICQTRKRGWTSKSTSSQLTTHALQARCGAGDEHSPSFQSWIFGSVRYGIIFNILQFIRLVNGCPMTCSSTWLRIFISFNGHN